MTGRVIKRVAPVLVIAALIAGGVYAVLHQEPVAANPQTGTGAKLDITVSGIASNKGEVLVSVCDRASFLKECAYGKADKAVANGAVHFMFDRIPPGRYAIMAFHDENGNRHFDTAANGLPLEGYGFSRNAKGNYGPPSFDDAAIDVPASGAEAGISLIY